VAIPASVTEIGFSAFEDCSSLVSVNVADGAHIEFDRDVFYGTKLDVKSQLALKKAGYTENF